MHIKKRQIPDTFEKAVRAHQQGNHTQAIVLLQAILKADSRHADTLHLVGLLKASAGLFDEAVQFIKKAINADSAQADYYNSLGVTLRKAGHISEAEKAYHRCLQRAPEHLEARSNLGTLLRHQKRYVEAIAVCRQLVKRVPGDIKARINLGGALHENGNLLEAQEQFLYALSLQPNRQTKASIYTNLANIHWTLGDAAQSSHYQALVADLTGQPTDVANYLLAQNYLHVSGDELAQSYRDAARYFSENQLTTASARPALPKNYPLRIGYVSPDLVDHPVGWLLAPVVANHDKSRFTIIIYDIHQGERHPLDNLVATCSLWRNCRKLTGTQVADCIEQDAIDILVDLAGHTAPMGIFRQRLAPIQVTWLGYFHTTCLPTIDWLLADQFSIPLGEDQYYTEKIYRLPHFRFCFQPPPFNLELSDPPCLHNNFITFGSFNNPLKLTDLILDTWARILLTVPGSRLLLRWPTFSLADVRQRLMQKFAERNIHADRLKLLDGLTHAELLSAYAEIDIALDPFPFCGGMTSLEALWMGVPVITLTGNRMAGRQSQAFLNLSGHPELISATIEEYIRLAAELAADRNRLQNLRYRLRTDLAASPLCDCRRFTTDLEATYCKLLEKLCTL